MKTSRPAPHRGWTWHVSDGASMYSLFQIMTLASWSMGIVIRAMEVHPGCLAEQRGDTGRAPIVVEFMLSLRDSNLHNNRLAHRRFAEPDRNGERHLEQFETIRNLQSAMRRSAANAGIREFDVGGAEDLTQQIVKEIVRQALE